MSARRATLIVNPVAGADEGEDWLPELEARLRRVFADLTVVVTTGPGHATTAAASAVESGCTHVFSAGGDGTLNEVVNGLAAHSPRSSITLGIIPLGTGNDFAAALGIPRDIGVALSLLEADDAIDVDICRLNSRYFINVSAGGFIAEVSDAASETLKTVAGQLAYILGGAQVIWTFDPFHAEITFAPDAAPLGKPGAPLRMSHDLLAFAVCNAPLIGGGRLIAPEARFDDGQVDVCLIEAMPLLEFVNVLRLVADGAHVEHERVQYVRTSALTLRFDRALKVNTDGEVIVTERCEYDVLPGALRVLAGRRGMLRAV